MEQAVIDRPPVVSLFFKIVLLLISPLILILQPLRISSTIANEIVGVLLMILLPWIACTMLFRLRRRWATILGGVLCFPLFLYSALLTFLLLFSGISFKDGQIYSFERFAETEWNQSRVRLYRTNGGATTSFGMVIRHERAIFPGLVLTRNLDDFYRCYGLNLASTTQGVTVNNQGHHCPEFGPNQRSYQLKRFVFF